MTHLKLFGGYNWWKENISEGEGWFPHALILFSWLSLFSNDCAQDVSGACCHLALFQNGPFQEYDYLAWYEL